MRRFEEKEIEYLKENYSKVSKNEIIKKINRSWNSIQKKCFKLGIKRDFNEFKYSFSINKFLNFNNVDCYWLGFMLADGHISKVKNIQINLSIKDKEHIYKLEEYIGHKIKIYEDENKIRAVIQDKPTINEISKIFEWKTNKTKNPPIIPNFINGDKLFSLIIGFIDGDGSIKKDGIYVRCDNSWNEILKDFYFELTREQKEFNLSGKCSIFYISKFDLLKNIKLKTQNLNLPTMKRKWDRINVNRIIRKDKTEIKKREIEVMLNESMGYEDIRKKTGYSYNLIWKVKNELKK